jgi:hypothetical protein
MALIKLFPLVTKHLLLNPKNPRAPLEANWDITLRKGSVKIGELTCDNTLVHGYVEFDVELEPEYTETSSYYREVYESMAGFLFRVKDVREVGCKCPGNDYIRREALDRSPFVFREREQDAFRYSITRQKTAWTGLYLMIGLFSGTVAGVLIGNLWIGTAVGVVIGVLTGLGQDLRRK